MQVYRVKYELREKELCACCKDAEHPRHEWQTLYTEPTPELHQAERTADKAWDYGGDNAEIGGVEIETTEVSWVPWRRP